jgi:hypothetical protein
MISSLMSALANQPTVGVSDGDLEVLKPLFSACFYIALPASFHAIRDGYIHFTSRAADEATYVR